MLRADLTALLPCFRQDRESMSFTTFMHILYLSMIDLLGKNNDIPNSWLASMLTMGYKVRTSRHVSSRHDHAHALASMC